MKSRDFGYKYSLDDSVGAGAGRRERSFSDKNSQNSVNVLAVTGVGCIFQKLAPLNPGFGALWDSMSF